MDLDDQEHRKKIAKSATNLLFDFVKERQVKDNQKLSTNVHLLHKRKGKINPKHMMKSPLCVIEKYSNAKECYIYTIRHTEMIRTRKNNEWFEDEGFIVTLYTSDSVYDITITRHAVKRAFERLWKIFKDETPEKWAWIFMKSAHNIRNAYYDYMQSNGYKYNYLKHQTIQLPFNGLDAIVQVEKVDSLIVLTYVKG